MVWFTSTRGIHFHAWLKFSKSCRNQKVTGTHIFGAIKKTFRPQLPKTLYVTWGVLVFFKVEIYLRRDSRHPPGCPSLLSSAASCIASLFPLSTAFFSFLGGGDAEGRKDQRRYNKDPTTTSAIKQIRPLFKVSISATIKPETPSRLVSNESSCSLLSSDVPGYEILT